MLGEVQIEKRGVHRRLSQGVRRLNKRVYVPTAIFTTDADPAPTTTAALPATPATSTTPGILLPPTTSTTSTTVAPIRPTTTSTTPTLASTTTTSSSVAAVPAAATTSSTSTRVAPATTQPQTTQTKVTTPVHHVTTQTLADALTEVTQTLTSTRSANAASAATSAASPTTSTTPKGNTSSGVIIGGIVAAVIGVAGILFMVVYFIRRSRKDNDYGEDENDFNAQAFRRQSTALPDDGVPPVSRSMTFNRGSNNNSPRPPTMIERKMGSTPGPYPMPTAPHPYGYAGAYAQPSFAPGQVMTPGPYTPTTVNSANPFFAPYGESPISSPVSVAPYDSAYNSEGQLITRQPSVASTAVLSRQPSSAVTPAAPAPSTEVEYVDLNRSSVTPFQAAQYAEISRHLNTAPPHALSASEVAEVAEELAEHDEPALLPPKKIVEPLELQPSISFDEPRHLAVAPTPREHAFPESPFADPTMSFHEEQVQHVPQRDSLPQPPSPAFSNSSRVTSQPPTLPEIHIQQRPFSPVSLDFPIAPSTPRPDPSPLASSFTMPSPPPNAHFPDAITAEPPAAPAPTAVPREPAPKVTPASKRPDTVYTLYDEEDAYGGM